MNITQVIDNEIKKKNLITMISKIEPSQWFYVDITVSKANRRRPLMAHIHAMMNQCAYASGIDPDDMKDQLKGLYMCDIARHTDKNFRAIVEQYERESGASIKGEVTGYHASIKELFGKSISMSKSNIQTLRFFRQKVEEHLGSIEAEHLLDPS